MRCAASTRCWRSWSSTPSEACGCCPGSRRGRAWRRRRIDRRDVDRVGRRDRARGRMAQGAAPACSGRASPGNDARRLGRTKPPYRSAAAAVENNADSASPSPARALPSAATASPARMRPLPSGRRRSPSSATDTAATVPRVPRDRQRAARQPVQMRLGLRNRIPCHGRRERHRDRDPDRDTGVEKGQGPRPAHAYAKERAGAEQGCGRQPAEKVVDPERGIIPSGRGAPCERGRPSAKAASAAAQTATSGAFRSR